MLKYVLYFVDLVFSKSLTLRRGRLGVLPEAPGWAQGRAVTEPCTLVVATQLFSS